MKAMKDTVKNKTMKKKKSKVAGTMVEMTEIAAVPMAVMTVRMEVVMEMTMEMMMEMDQGHPQMNAHQAMSKVEQREANERWQSYQSAEVRSHLLQPR
jgi:hypothetical protein